MKYKKQHFVTDSYTKAWCDPETPDGAFVWVVSKKDKKILRKSPKSLFVEDDFYTAYDLGGNRILELEHELKRMEDKFISLRDNKLKHHQPLTLEDRRDLALFISTMYARTKRQKEDGKQIWRDYVEMVEHLPPDASKLVKSTIAYQDVIRVHKDQPMLFHLYQFVNMTAPWLFSMNCAIYDTGISPGVITSDNPCFWFDPAGYNPAIPPTYFGVGSPTLMVLFPISPKQFVIYDQNGFDGYMDLSSKPEYEDDFVDSINKFTATNCDELIVVEATGGYQRAVVEALLHGGISGGGDPRPREIICPRQWTAGQDRQIRCLGVGSLWENHAAQTLCTEYKMRSLIQVRD